MCVHHGPFDIIQVCEVFKSPLQQSCLLTQLSNVGTVIVGKHLVPQDRICYLKKVYTRMKILIVFYITKGEVVFFNQGRELEPGEHV